VSSAKKRLAVEVERRKGPSPRPGLSRGLSQPRSIAQVYLTAEPEVASHAVEHAGVSVTMGDEGVDVTAGHM
jgi:hypothetical protein